MSHSRHITPNPTSITTHPRRTSAIRIMATSPGGRASSTAVLATLFTRRLGTSNATNFSGFRGGSLGISVGFFIEGNCEGFVLFPLPLGEREKTTPCCCSLKTSKNHTETLKEPEKLVALAGDIRPPCGQNANSWSNLRSQRIGLTIFDTAGCNEQICGINHTVSLNILIEVMLYPGPTIEVTTHQGHPGVIRPRYTGRVCLNENGQSASMSHPVCPCHAQK